MSEDSKVWEKKDRRIARMNCVTNAVNFVLQSGEFGKEIDTIIDVAKRFEEYIYEEIKDES